MLLSDLLTHHGWLRPAAWSLAWIVSVLLVRWLALRVVHRTATKTAERVHLRWTVQVRRSASVLIVLGLGFIWATELRTMALSITAIAVAIVIATKEMLLCVMGGVLRASAGSFSVGDRIEIGETRGDVIDHGLFATTILEIGPGHQWTGRAVTVPNSIMLTQSVINETYSDNYVLHVITVPVPWDAEWSEAQEALLEVAHEVCSDYLDDARQQLQAQAKDKGLDPPNVAPRVTVEIPEASKLNLLLRVPTEPRKKGVIEQRVLRRFLKAVGRHGVGAASEPHDELADR
jgi:small-conductance mechanosensitive channel